MNRIVTFGLGGWCENCDATHDHPLHNIVEIRELPDEPTDEVDESEEEPNDFGGDTNS